MTEYKKMKVLVADDDERLARPDLVDALKELGFQEIYEASDGSEAYDMFLQKNPDIILLDTEMPDSYGYNICRRIRSQPEGQRIKIIGMSNTPTREYSEKWNAAGVDYFADKVRFFDPDYYGDPDFSLECIIQRVLRK
ncbi:response regulator [Candidatus Woesearchaeota archaeon]|nr:response regulator [Candidatus Woesearchaeota archaeon]